MAAPQTTATITFNDQLGESDPTYTFDDVWGDDGDLVVTFDGEVVGDSCADDSPVIAANTSYSGPVIIDFNRAVSGISLEAGCFDAVRSTRVVIFGENGFKVETTFNPNADSSYHTFNFQYGENVIKRVAIRPIGNEPAGFAVDNVEVTYRPESEPVKKSNNTGIDSLISGNKWADNTIEWSFATSASDRPGYGTGPTTFGGSKNRVDTQDALTAGQKAMVRKALDMWDDAANIKFKKVADGDTPGQIRIARADIAANGDAFLPADTAQAGDVMLDITAQQNEKAPGTYIFSAVVLHEIGHALGLSHPHRSAGEGTALAAADDSIEFSVMSYRATPGAGLDEGVPGHGNHAETLMMNDIAAIQHLYGVNYKHGAGDTVYRFNPAEAKIFRTIWDGGGTDTYDASNYTTKVRIDLAPGAWTQLKKGQRAILDQNSVATEADDELARGNVANALLYKGGLRSLIENAKGGSGDDRISGNQAKNVLTGKEGDDRLIGLKADDILRGGEGRDKLFGGRGDDVLRGDAGRDEMTGGAGNDLFVFLNASDGAVQERIRDFVKGDDHIGLTFIDADTTTSGDQAFTFIGDAAFTAAGQLRAVVGGGDTLILGDTDGDGRTDFRVFLTGEMTLAASDFLL